MEVQMDAAIIVNCHRRVQVQIRSNNLEEGEEEVEETIAAAAVVMVVAIRVQSRAHIVINSSEKWAWPRAKPPMLRIISVIYHMVLKL